MAREKTGKSKKITEGNGFTIGGSNDFGLSLASILGKEKQSSATKQTEEKNKTEQNKKETATAPKELKIPKVSLQKKSAGCGGKTVTVITIAKESNCTADTILKEIKKALGCGARIEEGKIILQGDIKERAAEWFAKKGVKNIVLG